MYVSVLIRIKTAINPHFWKYFTLSQYLCWGLCIFLFSKIYPIRLLLWLFACLWSSFFGSVNKDLDFHFRIAQRQHLGSCKSIQTKRERSESDREDRLRNPSYNPIREEVARWWWTPCFASNTKCLTQSTEVVLLTMDAFMAWSISWPIYPLMGVFIQQVAEWFWNAWPMPI